jgi:hypothetical protein
MEELRKACEEFMAWLESDDYHEDGMDDHENAVFEAAMEAVFGEEIWDRVNAAMG